MIALEVDRLSAGYGLLTAVWNVSLQVEEGQVAAVIGPNGAGKSTLLGAIFGIVETHSGTAHVHGEDLSGLDYPQRRSRGLGLLPEGRNPFEHLTVKDNLYVGAWVAGYHGRFEATVDQLCKRFPIIRRRFGQRAGTLSGGEQQILALGRVLIQEPKVVLLDEPTTGLAPAIVHTLADAIIDTKKSGVSWVITEQNVAWLAPLVDVVYVMNGGRVIHVGGPEMITNRERLRSAYLSGSTGVPDARRGGGAK